MRTAIAVVGVAACLWSLEGTCFAQAAPSEAGGFSVDQARLAYSASGYQVSESHAWNWMQPPFASFRVTDPETGRVLTVVIYASTDDADTARVEARGTQRQGSVGVDGPLLVWGFGPSVWNGNVALVQSTESRLYRFASNGGMYDAAGSRFEPVTDTVDLDFQRALTHGVVNL
jgi:hypothetical protein